MLIRVATEGQGATAPSLLRLGPGIRANTMSLWGEYPYVV